MNNESISIGKLKIKNKKIKNFFIIVGSQHEGAWAFGLKKDVWKLFKKKKRLYRIEKVIK